MSSRPLPPLTLADLGRCDRFDGELWSIRDGALGAAWTVRAHAAGLHEVVANYIYGEDFAGAYLQILWGGTASDGCIVTLKAFLPPIRTSWATAAARLIRHRSVCVDAWARRRSGRTAFLAQTRALEEVASLAALRPRPITDPEVLRAVSQLAFGELPGGAPPAVTQVALPPVASLRRHPTLALHELPALLEDRPGFSALRTLTFVQRSRADHRADAWLYPFVTAPAIAFQHLERGWARDGYRLMPERALEFAARMFVLPFGPVPALEANLATCAIRVQMGHRPLAPDSAARGVCAPSPEVCTRPDPVEPTQWAA